MLQVALLAYNSILSHSTRVVAWNKIHRSTCRIKSQHIGCLQTSAHCKRGETSHLMKQGTMKTETAVIVHLALHRKNADQTWFCKGINKTVNKTILHGVLAFSTLNACISFDWGDLPHYTMIIAWHRLPWWANCITTTEILQQLKYNNDWITTSSLRFPCRSLKSWQLHIQYKFCHYYICLVPAACYLPRWHP